MLCCVSVAVGHKDKVHHDPERDYRAEQMKGFIWAGLSPDLQCPCK